MCGTDREISEGMFGVAPAGSERLLLGHEFLGVVERGRARLRARRHRGGDRAALVRALRGVRRGIAGRLPHRRLLRARHHPAGRLRQRAGRRGRRAPGALCRARSDGSGCWPSPRRSARGRSVTRAPSAERQPWRTERALVIGAGAIGMLSTYFLRLDGFEVWVAGRSPGPTPKTELAEACGARYVSTAEISLAELAGETGGFDLVIEAAGDAQVMLDTLGAPAPERGCVPPRRGRAQPRPWSSTGRCSGWTRSSRTERSSAASTLTRATGTTR